MVVDYLSLSITAHSKKQLLYVDMQRLIYPLPCLPVCHHILLKIHVTRGPPTKSHATWYISRRTLHALQVAATQRTRTWKTMDGNDETETTKTCPTAYPAGLQGSVLYEVQRTIGWTLEISFGETKQDMTAPPRTPTSPKFHFRQIERRRPNGRDLFHVACGPGTQKSHVAGTPRCRIHPPFNLFPWHVHRALPIIEH